MKKLMDWTCILLFATTGTLAFALKPMNPFTQFFFGGAKPVSQPEAPAVPTVSRPPTEKPGRKQREDLTDLYERTLDVYEGRYAGVEGTKNIPETVKDVIRLASSGELEILHNKRWTIARNSDRAAIDPGKTINLKNLHFCPRGEYADVAKLFEGYTTENERNSMFAALASCMIAKETSNSWRHKDGLLTPNKKTGLLSPDSYGVVGLGQLDYSSKKGNQGVCIDQFKTWRYTTEFGMKTTNIGPAYAAQPDQRYNIACSTYLYMSAWMSSQIRDGHCADIVPTQGMQFGSLHGPQFKYCVKKMADSHSVAFILQNLYGNDKLATTAH